MKRPKERVPAPPRQAHGRDFWRATLEELEAEPASALSRRGFLQMVAASAALAGLSSACFEAPEERILPYTRRPDDVLPGVPSRYATTLELAGHGVGVLVESHEGRPVKVEGNPDHPASLGAAGVYEQASLLDLYDPERLRNLQHERRPVPWRQLLAAVATPADARPGATRLLLEPTASPLVQAWLARLQQRRPDVAVHFYAPLESPTARTVTRRLFGRPLQPLVAFEAADVVVSLDADFLDQGPFRLRHARDFASRRRILERDGAMNRLYSAAPSPSLTSEMADHHVACESGALRALAAALTLAVMDRLTAERTAPALPPRALDSLRPTLEALAQGTPEPEWVRVAAADLTRPDATGVVVVGEAQLPEIQALGHAINALLPRAHRCLRWIRPPLRTAEGPSETLPALVEAALAGEVRTLAVLGGNPSYDAPPHLGFDAAFARVDERVALSLRPDETTLRAQWQIPRLHPLESWSDARALDGTASIVQPLIAPLYGGWTVADALAAFAGERDSRSHERLRRHWGGPAAGDAGPDAVEAERRWRRILRRGVVPGTGFPSETPRLDAAALGALVREAREATLPEGQVEIVFRQDATLYDGRHANNPWLQELPDPITKLTWDNAAWLAPSLARRLGVGHGDWIELARGDRLLRLPVLVVLGQAERAVTLSFGYGRDAPLAVARDVGFDVYPLWGGRFRGVPARVSVAEGAEPFPLARTQEHFDLHDREHLILHRVALDEYRTSAPEHHFDASLYPPLVPAEVQWGMAVDLTVCTGCAACVVACQAENNIPVVGKEGVLHGREMHWIRIDRYQVEGHGGEPTPVPQPMLCQHCEMAPCEYVCPVNATVHSADGLNEMIYNRCVGTRFCSNNCPYKVRRFNWFEYNGDVPPAHRMQHNPQVTVRARGVMEKCTYCVQRIRTAQIDARNQERALRDGEVATACQQACPTRAIAFGDVSDPDTEVSRILRAPQEYAVLEELGTRPRTRYLARIHNPHPDLTTGRKEVARPASRATGPASLAGRSSDGNAT